MILKMFSPKQMVKKLAILTPLKCIYKCTKYDLNFGFQEKKIFVETSINSDSNIDACANVLGLWGRPEGEQHPDQHVLQAEGRGILHVQHGRRQARRRVKVTQNFFRDKIFGL
jgi:hypothetical protein